MNLCNSCIFRTNQNKFGCIAKICSEPVKECWGYIQREDDDPEWPKTCSLCRMFNELCPGYGICMNEFIDKTTECDLENILRLIKAKIISEETKACIRYHSKELHAAKMNESL